MVLFAKGRNVPVSSPALSQSDRGRFRGAFLRLVFLKLLSGGGRGGGQRLRRRRRMAFPNTERRDFSTARDERERRACEPARSPGPDRTPLIDAIIEGGAVGGTDRGRRKRGRALAHTRARALTHRNWVGQPRSRRLRDLPWDVAGGARDAAVDGLGCASVVLVVGVADVTGARACLGVFEMWEEASQSLLFVYVVFVIAIKMLPNCFIWSNMISV